MQRSRANRVRGFVSGLAGVARGVLPNGVVSLAVMFALLAALPVQAQTQVLGGDPVEGALKIECNNSGMRVLAYLDGAWKQQTYSDNKSSMVHYEQGGTFKYTAGYYQGTAMTCTKNANISVTVNERIWTGGSVQLTMRTIYQSPSRTMNYEFEIQNTSGSALSNVKFFHGQDTYLGYSDAGGGYWDNANGVVGVKKPAQDNPSRDIYQTLGSASQKPDDYASAGYGTVAGRVAQGSLNGTIDANVTTDNGFAVQWDRGSLAPGETWTISASETMAVGAALTAELTGGTIGTSTVVTGLVENAGESTTVNLSVGINQAGWTAEISGSTSFSLSTGQSQEVLINVTCPPLVSVGQVATVTLTATGEESEVDATANVTGVYYDGVALVQGVTDDGPTSISENTDFGGRLVGTVVTNTYRLYNGGPSNITQLTYSLTGSGRFQVAGIPASLAAGASTNFTVTFDAASYATEVATLTFDDHKPWSPFVMNLQGYGYVISPDNGPKAGGNLVTITNGTLGSGADISRVAVGGKNAELVDQGTNWVSFLVPAQASSGWKDVAITSVSGGTKTMRKSYLVHSAPYISSVSPNVAEGAGVTVTIQGSNLSNGHLSDVTNVRICGVAATDWQVNGTTEIVVKTGAGGNGKGHVIVDSISRGRGIKYNGFTYGGAKCSVVYPTTGAEAQSGETAKTKYGTDFGYVAVGRSGEREFAIKNAGIMPLSVSMVSKTGPGADSFSVLSSPSAVAAGSQQPLRVAFSSDVPVNAEATLLIYNSSTNSPFRLNLLAEAITVTPTEGSTQGGTSVLLTNMTFGTLGTLAEVRFSGSGTITDMGTNWIRFTTPPHAAGWADAAVSDAIESRSLLNSFYFNPAGGISSISPSSCTWGGGTQVTITGVNLCAGLDDLISVELDGVKVASIVSASPTEIVVVAAPGFGGTHYSYIRSVKYGTTKSTYDKFKYTGQSGISYGFSPAAGTASGGTEVTFTFSDMGSPVVVTQVMVNGSSAQVTGCDSNSVRFLTPPVDWAWTHITDLTLSTENHGFASFSSPTNLGYTYRDKAFIGRPDIQNAVWQGEWKNLGFGMLTSRDDIESLAFGPDGKLYAAGELDLPYDDSQVAYFENGAWKGTGIEATYVDSMIRHGDDLYVGGYKLENYYDASIVAGPILRGSGTSWTSLTYAAATANPYPRSLALHHDGTNLYASDYNGALSRSDVLRYDGSSWAALADNSYTTTVHALGTYQGRLYRSGERDWQVNHYANPVQYWDGSAWPDAGWVNTNDYSYSYSARALSFCEFKGKYYAGQAYFDPYTADSAKMQLMVRDGISYNPGWVNVPGFVGMAQMMNKDRTGTRALTTDGEYLFAAGVQMHYTPAPPGDNYSCVAAFDGTSWSAIGTQGLSTNWGEWGNNAWHINSLIKTPRGIYAGGWFDEIGTDPANITDAINVAFFEFDLTNGLVPQTGSAAGGTQVTIHGFNLGNGTTADVYRVTICGVDVASIDSVSSTQIVVTTAAGAGTGDAVVYTHDYGIITASNVFTYTGGSGLELYGDDNQLLANGDAADMASGTSKNVLVGYPVTNSFALVNPGDTTLNITGVQTNGAGADAFACIWPSSLAAGQTGVVQVVFQPVASGTSTASVQVANNSAGNNPFVLNLECVAAGISANNGPYAGGNTITLTNLAVGTVTNVYIGATQVSPLQSGADWLTLVLPGATSAGAVDIVLQTSDNGNFTFSGAYTYNPAGRINRMVNDGFAIGSAYTSWGDTLSVSYRSRHYQYIYTTNDLAAAGIEGPATITAVGYNIYQAPAHALPRFQFRMKHTAANVMTGGFQPDDLVVCYSNALYAPLTAPLAGGFDMLDFTTPFEWDGQQNILLDSAFAPTPSTSSSGRNYAFYAPGNAHQRRYLYSSTDQSDVFTGGSTDYTMAQLGVRATFGTHGVSPRFGITTGGYEVVISGRDLCAGDVTSVTLCGVEVAEIVSASATQVVVRAGTAPGDMAGAVTIHSTSHGVSTLADAFRYVGTYSVIGTDGSLIPSGSTPSAANGTVFANTGGGAALTHTLAITNNIGSPLTISSIGFAGGQADAFSVTPTNLTLTGYGITNVAVVFNPQTGGEPVSTMVIESDSGNASIPFSGSAWSVSPSFGSSEGGVSVTINNGEVMGLGDITAVFVDGIEVAPIAQGDTWVTFTTPAHAEGTVDIVVRSTAFGDTGLANAYTYLPPSVIYGNDLVWEALPGLPLAVNDAVTFSLHDALYVAGGTDGSTSLTNVYRFHGDSWQSVAGLPESRHAGAGAVYSNAFYYGGGYDGSTAQSTVYRFDGTNWSQVADLPQPRAGSVAGVVGDRLILAAGTDGSSLHTNVYQFDGSTWSEAAGIPEARSMQGGAVRRGQLYAFGGNNAAGTATFNQYRYNGLSWTADAGLPALAADMGSATLNQRVYSIGGRSGETVSTNVYRYNGINWSEGPGLPQPLYGQAAAFWRGAIYAVGGARSEVPAHTNVYRLTDGGITPISGYTAGGYEVTIKGINLSDGTTNDVTGVTLCGVVADVTSVSATQIVVVAGASGVGPQTGDVVIHSQTFGTITAANGFSYLGGAITLVGTNGVDLAQGDAASAASGTDFGSMQVGQARTNVFGIRNTGNAPLTLSGVESIGAGAGSFTVTSFPTDELAVGATGQIAVVCASAGGEQVAQLAFLDSVYINPLAPEEGAYTTGVYRVKSYGYGTGLGLSQTSLTFNATYGGSTPAAQTFDVSNVGADPLTFSNAVVYAGFGQSWLSVTPLDGALNPAALQTVSASVSLAGLNAGTHSATVMVWSATATNSPQRVAVDLVIAPTAQTITWSNPGEQTYTNETLLAAAASSGLPVGYGVVGGPVVLENRTNGTYATYSSTGIVTVVASQGGNLNYGAAAAVTQSWEVVRAPGQIALTNLVQGYTGGPISPAGLTSPTGLTYTLTFDGNSWAPTNVGSYEVIATITDEFVYGSVTGTLEITKGAQAITFAPIAAQHTNATVGLSATGGATGNPVTFAIGGGPGSIAGGTNLTFFGIGDVLVVANQAGDVNYVAAPAVTNLVRVFSVTPDNGPYAGGNSVVVSNGNFGTITNVVVGDLTDPIDLIDSGANWFAIVMPPATNAGLVDITVRTSDHGDILLTDAYRYNPAGAISGGGSVTNAYIIGSGTMTNPASAAGYSPIVFYYYSSHYQFLYQASDFANAGLTGPARITALGFDVVSDTAGKALPSFLVRMKHSDVENMAGGMQGADLTLCYSNAAYLATAGGFDMLAFETPFEWDGSSNVIVDTAFAKASTWGNVGQTTYDPISQRGSAYRTDSFDTRYDFTHGSTIDVLPRIRVETVTDSLPVIPSSGSWTGGYEVVISGTNLGDGGDITNVMLCGVSATIVSQAVDRVWVTAGQALNSGLGDVRVHSTSYGETVGSGLFTYEGPGIAISGPAFGPVTPGSVETNIFTVTNGGTESLVITAATNSGAHAGMFDVSGFAGLTVAPGTASNVPVVFTAGSVVGAFSATSHVDNLGPASNYTFTVSGSVYSASTNIGPYAGGNTITITNGHFGTITNVLVGGVDAVDIVDSGANWFTIVLPATTNAGVVDIVVQTSDNGDITLAGAYTYNPAGVIAGSILVEGGPYIAGGARHSLGLKSDSAIVAWGFNNIGQTDVPAPNTNFVAVAAGFYHSLGLKSDGTIIGWGYNVYGQTDVPAPNTNFVAVAGGSGHSLGLKSDGSIVAWGANGGGQTDVPAPNTNFVAVAAGYSHSLGLKSDGRIVGWGDNHLGQTDVPAPNTNFVAVAAGANHSLGLKSDGTIMGWGHNVHGQTDVPVPNTNFVAVAAGANHSLGLKSDGTIVAWGDNGDGRTDVPAPNTDFGMFTDGVSPSSGAWTGGYEVVINGENLCDGGDVTDVTLCGVSVVSIDSMSADQIVVTAGAGAPGLGDVRVFSTSFGETVKSNAFEYLLAEQDALVFSPASPQTYNTTNALSTTGGSGDGLVSYEVLSGPGEILGGLLLPVGGPQPLVIEHGDDYALLVTSGTGTVTVVATKAGDELYLSTSATATVAAAKAPQVITFANPGGQLTTDVTPIVATASSGLPVGLEVTSGPATLSTEVSPATLTYSGAGSVAVQASQAGNDNWAAAADVTQAFTVSPAVTPVAVHRLWSDPQQRHFFTASAAERDRLLDDPAGGWTYEGIAFHAFRQATDGTRPVHRFWLQPLRGHLFTMSEDEKAALESRFPQAFTYEGHAWHAFPEQVHGTLPVHRFWGPGGKRLFFTISESEKAHVMATMGDVWRYEGIAFYAYAEASIQQPAALSDDTKAPAVAAALVADVSSEKPVASATFGLKYGPDVVVEAALYDPQATNLIPVLAPTVSPQSVEIPVLPPDQRYWLSIMSRAPDAGEPRLDYGGWLGRVSVLPSDEVAPVSVDPDGPVGLPVEHVVLPQGKGLLTLHLYGEDRVLQTLEGVRGGAIYDLTLPAWNQWYYLEIIDETSGTLLEAFWIGHQRTH